MWTVYSLREGIFYSNTEYFIIIMQVMEKGGSFTVDNPFLSCPTTSTLNVELLLPSSICCAEAEKEEVSFGTIKPTFATAKMGLFF